MAESLLPIKDEPGYEMDLLADNNTYLLCRYG